MPPDQQPLTPPAATALQQAEKRSRHFFTLSQVYQAGTIIAILGSFLLWVGNTGKASGVTEQRMDDQDIRITANEQNITALAKEFHDSQSMIIKNQSDQLELLHQLANKEK